MPKTPRNAARPLANEGDRFTHMLKLWLGGDALFRYRVTEADAVRISDALREPPLSASPFMLIDSDQLAVALRRSSVRVAHVLEAPAPWATPPVPDPLADHPVRAFVAGVDQPLTFQVEPDPPIGDPEDPDFRPGPLAEVLDILESDFGPFATEFTDEDGEVILISRHHLELLEVPRIYLEPDRWAAFADALHHAQL